MQLFINNIHNLKNRQVSNMIIDTIQNSSYNPRQPHSMYDQFGIILDILCSEGIVKLDEAEKKQIVAETADRLPQKMYMETACIELWTIFDLIVRDVLFGDVMNESDEMREIMQINTPSVTFSHYIDVAELTRQMSILTRIFREKNIAHDKTVQQVIEKISTKIFMNIECIRRFNTNNRDVEKIYGKHISAIINESIVYNICKEICEIGKSEIENNEFCDLWIGMCNVYQTQYKKKIQDTTQKTGYCQMVQKMVQVKQEMASQIKKRGEQCIFQKVKEVVEIVCGILTKPTEIVKVATNNTELQHIECLCPVIIQEHAQTRIRTHFTKARGIHLLHKENNNKVTDTQNIMLPANIYATFEDRHNILQVADISRFSTKNIITWQRKNVLISFLHIIWSIFGREYK